MSRGSDTTLLGTVASGLELNTLVPRDEGRVPRGRCTLLSRRGLRCVGPLKATIGPWLLSVALCLVTQSQTKTTNAPAERVKSVRSG